MLSLQLSPYVYVKVSVGLLDGNQPSTFSVILPPMEGPFKSSVIVSLGVSLAKPQCPVI